MSCNKEVALENPKIISPDRLLTDPSIDLLVYALFAKHLSAGFVEYSSGESVESA